jgi:hypothetical protein
MRGWCTIVLQVGEWDKAIALAPAVSQQYWCRLLQRHADFLSKQGGGTKELLPLMLATGQISALMQLLMNQKQYDVAADIAAVLACGWVLLPTDIALYSLLLPSHLPHL